MKKINHRRRAGAVSGPAKGPSQSTVKAATAYARTGLYTVPIPTRAKAPTLKGWTELRIRPSDVGSYFHDGRHQNVGVLLGPSGLVDIDLDCPEAIALAPLFLPPTRTFGRRSKRRSHYIFRVLDRRTTDRFQIPSPAGPVTLVEYRDSSKTGAPAQTVFPPSIHKTDEPIEWEGDRGKPFTDMRADDLYDRVSMLAGTAALVRLWPRESGGRHVLAGALGAVLARSAVGSIIDVGCLVGKIAEIAGDEESSDREQFATRSAETAAEDPDAALTGLPTLERLLCSTETEQQVLHKALSWLGFSGRVGRGTGFAGSSHSSSTGESNADVAEAESVEWADPEPVLHPIERAPVDAYLPEWLPDGVRQWVVDECRQMQVPLDFGAAGILVCLSSAVGRRIRIRPLTSTGWMATPNLWGVIVGRPGAKKTPIMKAITHPLRRLQAQANEVYEAEARRHEMEMQAYEVRLGASRRAANKQLAENLDSDIGNLMPDGDLPEAPKRIEYVVNDSSPEALVETARDNPMGFLQFRDELSGLMSRLSDPRAGEERALYLSSWNGDEGVAQKRIGRGYVRVEAVCQSVLGGIQPGKLKGLVRGALNGGSGDDGMIQRFQLMVYPDMSPEFELVSDPPDPAARRRAFKLFEALVTLDPETIGATQPLDFDGEPDGTPYLRFSSEAQPAFDAWLVALETRLRSGLLHPAIESHLSKFRSLVPSLALVLHLADGYDETTGVLKGAVGLSALRRAIAISRYLESHAARVYSSEVGAADVSARLLGRRILDGEVDAEFTCRDVYRKSWSGLNTKDAAQGSIDVLVEHGWLRPVKGQSGNRRFQSYKVNPALRDASAEAMLPSVAVK